MKRAGIDTGGTFTDFVFFEDGKLRSKKVLSTPQDPSSAVLSGMGEGTFFAVHGTTVATNAFLEGKTAKTALITTRGFRHILQIGRQIRVNLYGREVEKPPEIVPRELCFGVEERTLAHGRELKPLNRKQLEELAHELEKRGVEAVAVVFLHSYENPSHEVEAGKVLKEKFAVSLSHEVLNEHREYERAVATALNASLLPVMDRYLSRLETGIKGKLYIMNSAGGFIPPSLARKMPIFTLLSGPAGGIIAAHGFGKLIGLERMITLDMGGTSTDVSLIKASPAITRSSTLSHLPIRIPMIEIQTVGTGGGSIARIDEGGALKVGPQSAGADPGPACYGRSFLPTLTDALVVLGRIRAEFPLGGNLKIEPERSFKAIEKIASEASMDVYRAAEGILEVSLANTERAVKLVSVERGEDPWEFALLAFGGAGGLVAAELARRLSMAKVVIPPLQGVFSAFGMLLSDGVREYTSSFLQPLNRESVVESLRIFRHLEGIALREMSLEGRKPIFERYAEMRYSGQGYEIAVPFHEDPDKLKEEFEDAHRRLYFHTQPSPVEFVNLRLRAILPSEKPDIPEIPPGGGKPLFTDKIYYRDEFLKADFYSRDSLGRGQRISGPAVVASEDGTVFIPPDFVAIVGKYGEIWMEGENG